ncbi:MAG: septation protein IspZ [Gammaproteobacteria bacterium]|nr:septation protein IspZ [Gammaproteobacteria bacterium]
MQVLIEFLPLVAFLLAYKQAGIYAATATLMVAMLLLLAYDRLRHGRIPPMHLASAALVFVLGSATLWLHDERFIVWKPTILFWGLAVACVVSVLLRKPLIERLMTAASAEAFAGISRADWSLVTLVWAVFYAVMGLANLWVAGNYPQPIWVNFKVYGITGVTLVFVIAQTLWLSRRSVLDGDPKA